MPKGVYIRKYRPVAERFWAKVRKTRGCWLWLGGLRPNGYGQIGLVEDGVWRSVSCHRLSWELHYGKIPDTSWVLHRCDNPQCVRPHHLFLGDALSNMQDKASKRRDRKGYAYKQAKLTPQQVKEIRLYRGPYKTLAQQLQIGISTISDIKLGKRWKHYAAGLCSKASWLGRSTTKLTIPQIKQIYRMSGTQQSIADRFGISQAHVSSIKRGDVWTNITGA